MLHRFGLETLVNICLLLSGVQKWMPCDKCDFQFLSFQFYPSAEPMELPAFQGCNYWCYIFWNICFKFLNHFYSNLNNNRLTNYSFLRKPWIKSLLTWSVVQTTAGKLVKRCFASKGHSSCILCPQGGLECQFYWFETALVRPPSQEMYCTLSCHAARLQNTQGQVQIYASS